jgi:cellulose synthase/poly-beta-1,6-N-acetylglucosamine synthase-like glycosyltransferase
VAALQSEEIKHFVRIKANITLGAILCHWNNSDVLFDLCRRRSEYRVIKPIVIIILVSTSVIKPIVIIILVSTSVIKPIIIIIVMSVLKILHKLPH